MTAKEFIEGYAERSGVTVQFLLDNDRRVVCPCDCDEEICDGWQLTLQEIVDSWKALGVDMKPVTDLQPTSGDANEEINISQ